MNKPLNHLDAIEILVSDFDCVIAGCGDGSTATDQDQELSTETCTALSPDFESSINCHIHPLAD